jgi:hypothetical protein
VHDRLHTAHYPLASQSFSLKINCLLWHLSLWSRHHHLSSIRIERSRNRSDTWYHNVKFTPASRRNVDGFESNVYQYFLAGSWATQKHTQQKNTILRSLSTEEKEVRSQDSMFKLRQGNTSPITIKQHRYLHYDSSMQFVLQANQRYQGSADGQIRSCWRDFRDVRNCSGIVLVQDFRRLRKAW